MLKDVTLNSTHYFIIKILNKKELSQIAINHSSDIDFKEFIKIYKKCTAENYSFLINYTFFISNTYTRFKSNIHNHEVRQVIVI